MLLYKYCDPGGVAILEGDSIFLTRPRAFNDPFDLNPYITKFNDPVAMNDHLFRKMKDVVVLSLSENAESLLMWAHYAARHTGFLIGFDGPRILNRPTPMFQHFNAVSYCHHRASGRRIADLEEYEIYFRKSSEWAYEREWRLIESVLAIGGDVDDPKPKWPFPIRPESVKTVVVGHRGGAVLPKIVAALKPKRYQHVRLQFATPDLQKYRLNFRHWKREAWDGPPPVHLESVEP